MHMPYGPFSLLPSRSISLSKGTSNENPQEVFFVDKQEKILNFALLCLTYPLLNYCIRPNYCTVHLGFSELLGTLSCGKV